MSTSFERRKYFRREIFETRKIEYSLDNIDTETFEGIVLNINDHGICLLTSNRINIGQEVTLRDFDIYSSNKTATVKWIEKTHGSDYKVGLIFL